KRGAIVHAVDVSEAMLACARSKAAQAEIKGIQFHHAGFLTLELPPASVDCFTTTFSFHHLTDFWKGIALKRLYGMLKPGGQLYIKDVVIEESQALENIQKLID